MEMEPLVPGSLRCLRGRFSPGVRAGLKILERRLETFDGAVGLFLVGGEGGTECEAKCQKQNDFAFTTPGVIFAPRSCCLARLIGIFGNDLFPLLLRFQIISTSRGLRRCAMGFGH